MYACPAPQFNTFCLFFSRVWRQVAEGNQSAKTNSWMSTNNGVTTGKFFSRLVPFYRVLLSAPLILQFCRLVVNKNQYHCKNRHGILSFSSVEEISSSLFAFLIETPVWFSRDDLYSTSPFIQLTDKCYTPMSWIWFTIHILQAYIHTLVLHLYLQVKHMQFQLNSE